jgi:hypothetical protein
MIRGPGGSLALGGQVRGKKHKRRADKRKHELDAAAGQGA